MSMKILVMVVHTDDPLDKLENFSNILRMYVEINVNSKGKIVKFKGYVQTFEHMFWL